MPITEQIRRRGEDLERPDHIQDFRPGCGNQGHDFWRRIKTDANRRALIEYLKTL